MTSHFTLVLFILCAASVVAAGRNTKSSEDDVVYRAPFTLTVPIDRTHYYEEKKPRLPYVYHGGLGLFIGDHYGVKIVVENNTVRSMKYERDVSKADITFEFKQGDPVDGKATSLLIMHNRTKYTFLIEAAMTVPERKDFIPTSILPLGAGLSSYEAWPHAITSLGLRDFRVKK